MARILLIETSTAALSVALAVDGAVVSERVCMEPRRQASLTAVLVKEVLDEAGLAVRDCDAICVSAGPGSYTGLRVGVSTAKGLAFGASRPLISVGTLDILVQGARCPVGTGHDEGVIAGSDRPSYIVPMIDARRMEVYTAVFDADGHRLTPIEAVVVNADSFAKYMEGGEVLFVGDGAEKCREVLAHPRARFASAHPMARDMAVLAQAAFDAGRFENLAYFEPFYLKDFVATVSRKALW